MSDAASPSGSSTTGADVVICCRHEPDALPSVRDNTAAFVAADVREPDQIDAVVRFTTERFGRLDVLVNNAGGAPPSDTATVSPRFTTSIVALESHRAVRVRGSGRTPS